MTVIGSANINDRSMLGYRDSEVDVIIEDKDMIEGQMNGESYLVGKFSHGLRFHLFRTTYLTHLSPHTLDYLMKRTKIPV